MRNVTMSYGETEAVFPVETGTHGDGAIDISQLRATTGLVTLDRGFGNTAEGKSAVSFINGEEGTLSYRGYPIEQLADRATFIEVAYLLQFERLPTTHELEEYSDSLVRHTFVLEDFERLLGSFPMTVHPMQVLAASVSALGAYLPHDEDPLHPGNLDVASLGLIANMPSLIAWRHKYRSHQACVPPRTDLDYAANFLRMMFADPGDESAPNPVVAGALNMLLILHADHGQNLSTSAVRLVGSGHAHLLSSVAAGIHALSGPRHGGANEAVLNMLEQLHTSGQDVESILRRAKDKDDSFRLMGFGHRIYKNSDPRARILKRAVGDALEALGRDDPLLDLAIQLEQAALSDDYFVERKLYPNVDFYSGIMYRALGVPQDMFTVLFALGRLPGWISHYREVVSSPDSRIFRPRQLYVGDTGNDYVPIEER